MSILTIENNYVGLRGDPVSPETLVSFNQAIATDIDTNVDTTVFTYHLNNTVSIYNAGVNNAYLAFNNNGTVVFPGVPSNWCFKTIGHFIYLSGNITRYFVAPSNNTEGGLLIIALTFNSRGSLINTSYVVDNNFRPNSVGTIYQIETGLGSVTTVPNLGSGRWYDIVLLFKNGANFDFAYLDQSKLRASETPYQINQSNNKLLNTWRVNITYTYAHRAPDGGIHAANNPTVTWDNTSLAYYFAAGDLSSFDGQYLPTNPYYGLPSVTPVVCGTRDWKNFSYDVNPDGFDLDGNPLDNWEDFAVSQVKANKKGVIYIDSIPNTTLYSAVVN